MRTITWLSRTQILSALALAALTWPGSAATLYVSLESTNAVSPYDDWSRAAANIQDAVDAASAGDAVVVTNGVYQTGGRVVDGAMTNRVAVTNAITVRSVNGASVTIIHGYQVPGVTNGDGAVRCIYLAGGAVLEGFTLTNGATRAAGDEYTEQSGGGVWCSTWSEVVSNCVIAGNSAATRGGGAYYGALNHCSLVSNRAISPIVPPPENAGLGGGTFDSTLVNCTLTDNLASRYGGGAFYGELNNCTLTRNSALLDDGGGAYSATLNNCTLTGNWITGEYSRGGGASGGALNNCIVVSNSAPNGADYSFDAAVNYCCTPLQPDSGVGNITNAPLFVNYAGDDFRLQPGSPCINSGNNAFVASTTDLSGNPRIVRGTVDIGAYEYQGSGSVISYAWLQQYGLSTDGSADYTDVDSDRMNNWQEWICGTDPTNSASVMSMLATSNSVSGVTVSWQGVNNRTYFLERSTNLLLQPAFTPIQSNIVGQAGTTSFTDTKATGAGPFFYRVGIQ